MTSQLLWLSAKSPRQHGSQILACCRQTNRSQHSSKFPASPADETVSGESRVLYKLHNITQLYLQDDTIVAKSMHSIDNSGMAKVSNFKNTSLTGNLYGSFCKMQ